jgi:serine/threonine protein kinase
MVEMPLVGEEFAGYRLISVLGRGGMSTVFEAENPRLGNVIALKVLDPALATNDIFRTRFLEESRIAASMNHPNVIPIHDMGSSGGLLYIAMRRVTGTDLRQILKKHGHLPPSTTVNLLGQAARALDAAHRQGLVHRDVKPGNLLVERGSDGADPDHVYLADFGITKHLGGRSGLTSTGQSIGTIDYVAPEQIRGIAVLGMADQYSLGCVLYECLTGHVPFEKELDAAIIWAHVEEQPIQATLHRPELAPGIDAVFARVLAKNPGDRYESCREFMSAAADALGPLGEPEPATGPDQAPGSFVPRQPPQSFGSRPTPPPGAWETPTARGAWDEPSAAWRMPPGGRPQQLPPPVPGPAGPGYPAGAAGPGYPAGPGGPGYPGAGGYQGGHPGELTHEGADLANAPTANWPVGGIARPAPPVPGGLGVTRVEGPGVTRFETPGVTRFEGPGVTRIEGRPFGPPPGGGSGPGGPSGPGRRPGRRRGLSRGWLIALCALVVVAGGAAGVTLGLTSGKGGSPTAGAAPMASTAAGGSSMGASPSMSGEGMSLAAGTGCSSEQPGNGTNGPTTLTAVLTDANACSVPAHIIPTAKCKAQQAPAGEQAIMCTSPIPQISQVTFRTYPTMTALYAAYTSSVEVLRKGGTFQQNTKASCGTTGATYAEAGWNHQELHPRTYTEAQMSAGKVPQLDAMGRLACFATGKSQDLVWTTGVGKMLAVAVGSGSSGAVYNWWASIHHVIIFPKTEMCGMSGRMESVPLGNLVQVPVCPAGAGMSSTPDSGAGMSTAPAGGSMTSPAMTSPPAAKPSGSMSPGM